MKRIYWLVVTILVALVTAGIITAATPKNFVAPLNGGEENPPVATNSTGLAKFQLSRDGNVLNYKLIVANIDNVVAAHIHCGAAGVNGPIGVTLFAGAPVTTDGILAQGATSEPDAGNACGWADLTEIVAALESGDTYVNVHTNPGFPPGEIRGQVR